MSDDYNCNLASEAPLQSQPIDGDDARDILRTVLVQEPAEGQNFPDAIRKLIELIGPIELELPLRRSMKRRISKDVLA
jgi:hypothetical protein